MAFRSANLKLIHVTLLLATSTPVLAWNARRDAGNLMRAVGQVVQPRRPAPPPPTTTAPRPAPAPVPAPPPAGVAPNRNGGFSTNPTPAPGVSLTVPALRGLVLGAPLAAFAGLPSSGATVAESLARVPSPRLENPLPAIRMALQDGANSLERPIRDAGVAVGTAWRQIGEVLSTAARDLGRETAGVLRDGVAEMARVHRGNQEIFALAGRAQACLLTSCLSEIHWAEELRKTRRQIEDETRRAYDDAVAAERAGNPEAVLNLMGQELVLLRRLVQNLRSSRDAYTQSLAHESLMLAGVGHELRLREDMAAIGFQMSQAHASVQVLVSEFESRMTAPGAGASKQDEEAYNAEFRSLVESLVLAARQTERGMDVVVADALRAFSLAHLHYMSDRRIAINSHYRALLRETEQALVAAEARLQHITNEFNRVNRALPTDT